MKTQWVIINQTHEATACVGITHIWILMHNCEYWQETLIVTLMYIIL